MKRKHLLLLATSLCAAAPSPAQLAATVPYEVHGGGWMESGRVMHSSDPFYNLDDSWLQTVGAQISVKAQIEDNWEAAFGLGAYQVNHSLASTPDIGNQPKFLAITMFKSYLTEARVTYFRGDRLAPRFSATFGNFVHSYNPDVKNLGGYLLRGPVYPGALMGGYGEYGTDTTRANILGARVHYAHGGFSHDLLLMNEKDLPPTFDWSLAYIGKYSRPGAFTVGAGVNFYRLMPYDSDLETPGRLPGADPAMYEVTGSDTLFYTHKGVKLMAMFSLDPKYWLGPTTLLGAEDLKVYGEAAVIGVKDYGSYYDDIAERIPVMMGFNLPAFKVLDLLSLEVEWYGSPYRNDLTNIGNPGGIVADWTIQQRPTPSPAPVAHADSTRDDWKWSLRAQKTVAQRVLLSAQVANDHFRPRPIATGLITAGGGNATAFSTPEDWYFTFRVGYFF